MKDPTRTGRRERSPETPTTTTVYARIWTEDLEELRRREVTTGAPIAAQIRILIHDGLAARRSVK